MGNRGRGGGGKDRGEGREEWEQTRETFLPTKYGVGLSNDSAYVRIFSDG